MESMGGEAAAAVADAGKEADSVGTAGMVAGTDSGEAELLLLLLLHWRTLRWPEARAIKRCDRRSIFIPGGYATLIWQTRRAVADAAD